MSVIYNTATRTSRMDAVVTKIDAGVGVSTYEIGTTGFGTVLAVLNLANPCGTVTNGVLTFDCTPSLEDNSADATGTAAAARIKDGDGNIIVSGLTVGISGANLNLTSTAIVATEPVLVDSFSITEGNA